MPCHNCGAPLVEGVAFCQQCGTPVPPPTSSVAPTVFASQSPYGSPDPNPPTPSGPASQSPYSNPGPYTNYNPSSVPGSGQSYGTPQNPYGETPYNPNPYGTPPPPSNYTPAPPSNMPPYGSPQSGNMPSYGSPQPGNAPFAAGGFVAQPVVKPKRRVGLIVALVLALLVIVIVGAVVLSRPSTGSPTYTANATATAASTNPSGSTVDTTAASIITNIQMASAVDTDTLKPTTLKTNFQRDTDMYTTFQFDFRSTDVNQQKPGYVRAKYYIKGKNLYTAKPLKVDDNVAPDGYGYGYFTVQYNRASTDGVVEVYWCRQSDCNDEKLAGTTTFTVY